MGIIKLKELTNITSMNTTTSKHPIFNG